MTSPRNLLGPDTAVNRRRARDRRETARIHLPDRRLGFERRGDADASGWRPAYRRRVQRISTSPVEAGILFGSIVALAVADMAFTFAALDRGLEELNPVMAALLDSGHGVAAFVKVGVTALLAAAGWRYRRYRRVIEAGLLVAGLMSLVVVYHLLGLLVA